MLPDYIERLRAAVQATHGCHGIHSATARVIAFSFDGDVEVFDIDHPKSKKCYAWGRMEGDQFQATCILEISPVTSPHTAVDKVMASGQNLSM